MSRATAFDPDRIVAALGHAQVDYVIVGGLAVGAHGVVRATRDVDLVPDPAGENMAALAAVLVDLGGEHPIGGGLTVTRHGAVQVLNRVEGVPPFRELRADRILVELADDAVAPVCSLAHLLAMKRAAGRPRDQVDLTELARLHGSE